MNTRSGWKGKLNLCWSLLFPWGSNAKRNESPKGWQTFSKPRLRVDAQALRPVSKRKSNPKELPKRLQTGIQTMNRNTFIQRRWAGSQTNVRLRAGTITVTWHFENLFPKAKWESIEQVGSHLCFCELTSFKISQQIPETKKMTYCSAKDENMKHPVQIRFRSPHVKKWGKGIT